MCLKFNKHGKVSTKHIKIPQIPMAVTAIDTIGPLPVTFERKQMGLDSNLFTHIICLCNSSEKKPSENVVQGYLSSILPTKADG